MIGAPQPLPPLAAAGLIEGWAQDKGCNQSHRVGSRAQETAKLTVSDKRHFSQPRPLGYNYEKTAGVGAGEGAGGADDW